MVLVCKWLRVWTKCPDVLTILCKILPRTSDLLQNNDHPVFTHSKHTCYCCVFPAVVMPTLPPTMPPTPSPPPTIPPGWAGECFSYVLNTDILKRGSRLLFSGGVTMIQILWGVTCVAGNSHSGEHSCLGADTQVLPSIMEVLLVTRLAGGRDQHQSRCLVATCSWLCLALIRAALGSNTPRFLDC